MLLKIWNRTKRMAVGPSSLLLCVVLPCAMSASAQSNPVAFPAARWNSSSSLSGEITVLGAIRQVSDHVAGSPAGVHLLVSGPLGSFDASLGSYLSGEIRQALSTGQAVQITGRVQSFNGKDYLLVRQLNVAGHQVTVRNANGFLLHNPSTDGSSSAKVRSAGIGGVQ